MMLAISQFSNSPVWSVVAAGGVGLIIGFLAYRMLVRTTKKASIKDLGIVVGVMLGGTVTALFGDAHSSLFGVYVLGLVAGFILYFAGYLLLNGGKALGRVLGKRRGGGVEQG